MLRIKKTPLLLAFLMFLSSGITDVSFAKPKKPKDVSDVTAHAAETNRSVYEFKTGTHHWENNSLTPDTLINVCTNGCKSYTKKKAKDVFAKEVRNKKEIEKIFKSQDVWMKTHAGLSSKVGAPVFYLKDGKKKREEYWDVEGDTKGNTLVRQYIKNINRKKNGGLISGSFATTIIYTEQDGANDCPNGPCSPPTTQPQPKIPPEKSSPETDPDPDYDGESKRGYVSCQFGSGPKYAFDYTANAGNDRVEGVHSIYVRLVPNKPSDFYSLSPEQQSYWERTHHSQVEGPIQTEYGKYLDANRDLLRQMKEAGKLGVGASSKYRMLWEKFARGAREAIAKPLPDIEIYPTEENAEGFGRGGVFTYIEMHKTASVSTSHSQDYYEEYGCVNHPKVEVSHEWVCTQENKDGDCVQGHVETTTTTVNQYYYEKTKDRVIIDGQFTENEVVVVEASDYFPAISYQELNVRCNRSGFNSIVSSTGSTEQTSGSGVGSSTARSPIVTNTIATFFDGLDTHFFYEGKDCENSFGCSGNANPYASNSNDSKNNVSNTGEYIDGKFGAQSDGKSSSQFAFFRDNLSKKIRNDVWWLNPRNMGSEWVFSPSEEARATLITLDPQGTPRKDLFMLEDSSNSPLISGTLLESGKNYAIFHSQENEFNWRASWASDKNKPHHMNIKYAYKPHTTNTAIAEYNRNGGSTTYSEEYDLDMFCDTSFNTATETKPEVINKPKPITVYRPEKTFNPDKNKSLSVTFVKSSME